MADLHGQTLVNELTDTQRIAAGDQGQTGAVNILRDNLRAQFINPAVGATFTGGQIDLSNVAGTYYTAFTQSGNITFTYTGPINGGNAFIRITSNGTGTFTFTAAESFGITSGGTLPSGNHIFRFLQTPYGVSVAVFRETITPRSAGSALTLNGNDIDLGGAATGNVAITFASGQTFNLNNNTLSPLNNFGISVQDDLVSISNVTAAGSITFGISTAGGLQISDTISNRGLRGGADYSSNIQNLDYVQKAYVDPGTPTQRLNILTSTSNATSMDFASESRFREFSLSLAENTTISFSNATNRSSYKIFLSITGATRQITLPTGSIMPVSTSNSTDITWTAATRILELNAGSYELAADYNGNNDFWKITDRYA